mgnify:CR=1 FL=1
MLAGPCVRFALGPFLPGTYCAPALLVCNRACVTLAWALAVTGTAPAYRFACTPAVIC